MAFSKKLLRWLLLASAAFCSGCGKTALYSNVSERQANEMIALLRARNMAVGKQAGVENSWTITIAGNQFASAVDVLSSYGYPQDQFNTLGTVFQKSGLVSSPTEERARFMYALSENLAEIVSHIAGVVTARVSIVLPENNPYTDETTPSSAAVFATYRPGSSIEDSIRDIKQLIANSIEGLSYDKVSVALFPTPPISDDALGDDEMASVLSIRMTRSSIWAFWGLLLLVAAAAAACGFVGAKALFDYLAVRRDEKQRSGKGEAKSDAGAAAAAGGSEKEVGAESEDGGGSDEPEEAERLDAEGDK
ncbi:MAG: type III secretion inner membrane ring lipoprotein SctJ [Puniceicoccales bacterium]|jgi:type III secretion protein J|nr:type III secretion inner membrane ring lipoprotein SctJ [Puniceicoccales bacterium]